MPKREKNVEKKDFERYLVEARSWETDKVQQSEKSRKIAWWIAAAGVVVGLLGTASATLQATRAPAPPVVLRVDNSTGIVDAIKPLADGKTNYEEAVNKYFTQLYVRYREGYSKELAADYYTSVGIMSIGLEQQKYYEYFNPKNPQSPLTMYGPYAKVKVRIKSTSFIKPNVALVRYTRDVERGTDKPQVSHWAATITFRYSSAQMSEKDRAINPLGFQVVEYRNDNDASADTSSTTAIVRQTPAPAPSNNVVLFPGQGTYQEAAPAQPAAPAHTEQPAAPVVPAIQALK